MKEYFMVISEIADTVMRNKQFADVNKENYSMLYDYFD